MVKSPSRNQRHEKKDIVTEAAQKKLSRRGGGRIDLALWALILFIGI
jgi:hypothetical protein